MNTDGASRPRMDMDESVVVTVTERMAPGEVANVVHVLGAQVPISGPQHLFMRSAEPPEFIQLVGSAAVWAALGIAAAEFLRRVAARAADATWDAVSRSLKKNSIVDVSEALAKLCRAGPKHAHITIGLNLPDSYFGTSMVIKAHEPEAIAIAVSHFVVHAGLVEQAVLREMKEGHLVSGPARIIFDDGTLKLSYQDKDFAIREVQLNVQDTP